MHAPAVRSEIDEVVGYLRAQLSAIRTAAFGLSEEQARETPCRSGLSIGGLLKHAVFVCETRDQREAFPDGNIPVKEFTSRIGEFTDSFALTGEETLEGMLTRFDAAVDRYLARIAELDPSGRTMEPPAPWDGRNEPTPSTERFALLHHVEELARHAGHADIIREQLDGAQAGPLQAAVENRPGNEFITAWEPVSASR